MTIKPDERLIELITDLDSAGQFEIEDLDEMKLLHNHSRDQFPGAFNEILDDFLFSTIHLEQAQLLRRLLRVLEVDATIPEEFRQKTAADAAESSALVPTFKLNDEDRTRIAELCEKMRRIVFVTSDFDEPHRLRLLNRIAAIEAEIHKPLGTFDVVRGGMNDLGETLGKFGKDIKPLTDRMKEVVGIARKATKEYEQLPEPEEVERLPKPEDFEE